MKYDKFLTYFKNSSTLTKSIKEGKLDKIFKLYKEYMNDETFLGCGGDACGFLYKDDKTQVIKVCSKSITFFKSFETNKAQDLLHISRKNRYLLPINKILYDGEHAFVYLQNFCHILKPDEITPLMSIHMLNALKELSLQNMMTKLSVHNLAVYKDRIYVFDYHAMKRLPIDNNKTDNDRFKHIIRNTSLRYFLKLMTDKEYNKMRSDMKKDPEKFYKIMKKDKEIPRLYIQFLALTLQKEVDIKLLYKYINEAIIEIYKIIL